MMIVPVAIHHPHVVVQRYAPCSHNCHGCKRQRY